MFYWDWTMILVIPGLLLGLWAQMRVSSAFRKYSAVHARSGMSAEDVARSMLNQAGCGNVSIRSVSGNLTDHYDPRNNTLRLSDGVYGSSSVAAIGIAAHECGHAMQQHEGYAPLVLRSALVPVVNLGSNLYFPIFLLGLLFSWEPLIYVGIACFALTLVFSLATLPVEFNASGRALRVLDQQGYLSSEEMDGARARAERRGHDLCGGRHQQPIAAGASAHHRTRSQGLTKRRATAVGETFRVSVRELVAFFLFSARYYAGGGRRAHARRRTGAPCAAGRRRGREGKEHPSRLCLPGGRKWTVLWPHGPV